jgi:CheY-like chemotaxis protein
VLEVRDVVRGIEPMLRRLIGEHIDLRIEVDSEIARIKADPGQLEQVIVNLVVNARDAMPDGGRLTIAATMTTDAETRAPRVVLSVMDTGFGMADSVRDRIFEPFFTTKEPGKGTGLGLSTVYGIVRQSGATIEVDSAPGQGTTFTIAFPPVTEWVEEDRASEDEKLLTGTENVLLVEDDESVRAFARRTLEACGYTVLSASDGVEALALAGRTTGRIDALLTDIVMPRMNGPQLVERFIAGHSAAAVIYMSGYADDRIMQLEIDPGISFLRKPFTQQALARAIRDALDSTRRATHAA